MAKGVSKELEREIRSILDKFVGFPLGTEGYPRRTDSEPEKEATEYLIDIGFLRPCPTPFTVTLSLGKIGCSTPSD